MAESNRKPAGIGNYCSSLCEHNQDILRRFVRSKQLAGVSQNTINIYIQVIPTVVRCFGDVPLDELTKNDIEDWYLWVRDTPSKRTEKRLSPAAVRNYVMYLRQILESIHGEEKTAEMFKDIKPVCKNRVTVKEEELLTDDEISRLMAACEGERDRAIIAVLASSGCRVGELCHLRIKDVTLYRERVALHLNGKTGERDVDIFDGAPELKKWLQVHPYRDDREAPLFISKTHRGSAFPALKEKSVNALLNRLAKRAGISDNKRWNPHSFRHKRATDLADHLTQADLRVMFGWTDMSTTPNIYVHSSRAKVSRKLAELAGVKIPEHAVKSKLVKYCPVCGCANSINDKWCNYCFAVLDEEIAEAKKRVDAFMLGKLKEKKGE